MKRFVVFLFLLPFLTEAQKIRLNEYDKFIRQRRIETFPVNIKQEPPAKMALCFGSAGTDFYLQINGSGAGAYIIDANDKMMLQFDGDNTLTIPSKGYQNYDITSAREITYNHSYVLSLADIEKLSSYNLQSIRKSHADKFDDIVITKEDAEKIKNFSAAFLGELKKGEVLKKQTLVAAPGFPGGHEVWMKFLKRNLRMPIELDKEDKKTVIVQFLVRADGSADDFKIVQSQGPSYDNEVMRVLKRMPKWKPALENDRSTEAVVTQSIVFSRTDASVSSR